MEIVLYQVNVTSNEVPTNSVPCEHLHFRGVTSSPRMVTYPPTSLGDE
jgi:hypothetical protein